ncbi:hypothetical protein Z517_08240 [Fonsecaea pedrosoi CBS 271.37]|uniref:Acyl-CoA dehydrogenase/oxidase C-terminal domain-containing protein n=1 Tax=Fonsecaea pedrosoi CBS 271.37 TaxID=1442368 RepID=A0A0D2H166_9EURO|nr:uncharacterized protein Z517_08240 [Fonsecaea pedrosoi CBS 271.37]KIW78404.1 hypothetical protein Z517_08240 [Fonsecaea pedrosoi CBS 271.37]
MARRAASSSTEGYFHKLPVVPQLFTYFKEIGSASKASDDVVFERILRLYIPRDAQDEVFSSIDELSSTAIHPSTRRLTVDCETNPPRLIPLNTFGEINKVDPLWTGEGWRRLKEIGVSNGMVTRGYQSPSDERPTTWNRRVHQFGLGHVWVGHDALVTCPASMTDGAAKLVQRHLQDEDGSQPGLRRTLAEVYSRLISSDPTYAWTSGQWMTERTGGSNVRDTESVASRLGPTELEADNRNGRHLDAHGMPLGPWKIDGFKWFSSATDSDMALLLAQTDKGLSCFYAPIRRSSGGSTLSQNELNGVRIQRLKNKLGTRGLPTAELELKGMRGWLIGQEGKGVKEIAVILNLTRLYTATGGVGYWAGSLSVSRAFTRTRSIAHGLLQDNAAHLRWMAGETVKYWAHMHACFFQVALLGATEQPSIMQNTRAQGLFPPQATDVEALLRFLTPVFKARTSLESVLGVRECMESLGGVGYCENYEDGGTMNLSRLFRDANAGPIWEGTVSIMAEDALRVINDKRLGGGDVLQNVYAKWVRDVLRQVESSGAFRPEAAVVNTRLEALIQLCREVHGSQLQYEGRVILEHIEAITCAVVLLFDASLDKDEVADEIAKRWTWSIALPSSGVRPKQDWRARVALDKRIFLGSDAVLSSEARAKL